MPRRLRAFFRSKTLQANGRLFSLLGSDALLSRGGSPTWTYVPPRWNNPLPTFTFVEGTQSSQTFSGYFTDGNGGTSTITGQNLPSGVTVNSAARRLEYDGNGAVATGGTVTLTADDGYVPYADLTTLVIRDSSGTAGVVFKEGDVPAGSYVGSDLSGFQAEIKNSWPDGSAKIAVASWSGASAEQSSPQTIKIRRVATQNNAAAVSLQALRALNPSVSVYLSPFGTATLASVVNTNPHRTWLYGPVCSEWHWWCPVSGDGQLGVWFYVRLYAPSVAYPSGRVWVRCIIENGCNLMSVGNATLTWKKYHAAIVANGTQIYATVSDANLHMPHWNGTSYLLDSGGDPGFGANWYWPWAQGDMLPHTPRTRWSKEFWYDGLPVRAHGHDGTYLIGTKLWPNYGYTARVVGSYNSGYVIDDTPLMNANHRPNQQPAGSDPEIAYCAKWDVLYLLTAQGGADQQQFLRSVKANASASNSYDFYCRDPVTLEIYDPASGNAYLWNDSPSGGITNPSPTNANPPFRRDAEHSHSYAYTAYLVTGDHYFLETQQSHSIVLWYELHPYNREGYKGYFWGGGIAPRAMAWSWRNIAQSVCITPDSADTGSTAYKFKLFFTNLINNNVARHLAGHVDGTLSGNVPIANNPYHKDQNTLGYIGDVLEDGGHGYYKNNEDTFPTQYRGVSSWQQGFVSLSLCAMSDMKLLAPADQAELDRLADFTAGFMVKMKGDASGWPYPFGGSGVIPTYKGPLGANNDATNANLVKATTMAQAYQYWRDRFVDRTSNVMPALPADLRVALPATGAPMYNSTYEINTAHAAGGWLTDDGASNGYVGDPSGWSNSYWVNTLPGLCYAVDRGLAGAAAAYARMTSLSGTMVGGANGSWAYHSDGLNDNVQWGIKPRTA